MNGRNSLVSLHKSKQRPLVLDGAMGTLLLENGCANHPVLWSSLCNIENPDQVLKIHKHYIDAGADIITTNTFRTNPTAVDKSGYNIQVKEFVNKSVKLAIDARGENNVIIAGSNAPAEDCYQYERTLSVNDMEYNHHTHISFLWEAGCDIIWNETQSHFDEIEIIAKFCSENKLPFAMNLYFENNINLLSGQPLEEAIEMVSSYKPQVIGINCVTIANFEKALPYLESGKIQGFYINCGSGNVRDEKLTCGISASDYINKVISRVKLSPVFIGSCCGSSPKHTFEIKKYLNGIS